MRAMTILKRCRAAKQDLTRLGAQLERRRDAMGAFGGMRLDDIGGSRGGGESDRMAAMSAEIDEIERAIRDRKEAKLAEISSAVQLIDLAENELQGEILYRYYVGGDSCGEIARTKNYDRSHVQKQKKAGEQAMGRLTGEAVAATLPPWYLARWPEAEEKRRETT